MAYFKFEKFKVLIVLLGGQVSLQVLKFSLSSFHQRLIFEFIPLLSRLNSLTNWDQLNEISVSISLLLILFSRLVKPRTAKVLDRQLLSPADDFRSLDILYRALQMAF